MKKEESKFEELEKVYPLTELVEDIYDIDKETAKNYEACYKELQRIDKVLRQISDFSMTTGVVQRNRDRYVLMIRELISDRELKKVIVKISRNKKLTEIEDDMYHEFFYKYIDNEKDKEIFNGMRLINKKIENITGKVTRFVNIIPTYFDIESTDLMNIVLDEYETKVDELNVWLKKRCEQLDEIDDERYKEKILRGLAQYGVRNIKEEKSKDKKS